MSTGIAGMTSGPPRSSIATQGAIDTARDRPGRGTGLTDGDRRRGIEGTMAPPQPSDDERLVARLRAGNEAAFVQLVDRHDRSLWRIARMYTTDAVADEVVQETWLAVLNGLDAFEGRASIRTWMVRILINIARNRREREQRQIPFSAFVEPSVGTEASVDPDRFQKSGDRFPGGWISFPERWDEQPESHYLSSEGVEIARRAIATLPAAQREVVSLRDIEGWSSDEVCETLGISPGNQRVLLHRGRSRVRTALELAMDDAAIHGGIRQ
jgi:RNA polymerase sigma-70 factor (ECF subfamily)